MKARTDTTYCVNKECTKKCSRHESHYEFEENKNYSWQFGCKKWMGGKNIQRTGDKLEPVKEEKV